MPWQGRDAKALADFLAACPRLNETQFRQMVGNRGRSAVAHGDRVYKNTRIGYGDVAMDRLTAEEWKIVDRIKAERDKAKGKATA
jgi:hypothetical protein